MWADRCWALLERDFVLQDDCFTSREELGDLIVFSFTQCSSTDVLPPSWFLPGQPRSAGLLFQGHRARIWGSVPLGPDPCVLRLRAAGCAVSALNAGSWTQSPGLGGHREGCVCPPGELYPSGGDSSTWAVWRARREEARPLTGGRWCSASRGSSGRPHGARALPCVPVAARLLSLRIVRWGSPRLSAAFFCALCSFPDTSPLCCGRSVRIF